MATRSATPARHLRIADDIWDAASDRAVLNGETVSDVVRRALADYADLPSPERPAAWTWSPTEGQRRVIMRIAGGAPAEGEPKRTVTVLRREAILEEDGTLSPEGRRVARRLVARRVATP